MDKFTETYLNDFKEEDRFAELKERFSTVSDDKEQQVKDIIELLNISYADEELAEYNYFASYNLSKTDGKSDVDPEFEQHEDEERDHKNKLINRLRELRQSVPCIPIEKWKDYNSRGKKWKQECDNNSLDILLNRDEEEIQAIEWYELCVNYTKLTSDSTTYTLFKELKADEEKHHKDLMDLKSEYGQIKENE